MKYEKNRAARITTPVKVGRNLTFDVDGWFKRKNGKLEKNEAG